MKYLVPLFFYVIVSAQSWALCLPDSAVLKNKLRFTSNMESSEHALAIEETALKLEQKFSPQLKNDYKVDFNINFETLNPRVNAEITWKEKDLVISVWGGMIHHENMDPKVMTLLLCHELGHMLGGPPYRSQKGWSSTEGQADYFSTLNCVRQFDFTQEDLIQSALKLTSIYAEVTGEMAPEADRCEEKIVTRINYGYPTAQCRFDTMVNGWNSLARPRCWFAE